ncbi:phosphatase PAP2 family protein [Streptomyces durbertensis]|uniref:Phosphatase PAP2 family protein n=1 Tax=Streptomyces durbertensis TaxID=2448886 RepID=A0ABR6EJM5_9ACTN|nr:phosphatase PAP2 family protein [Streptomyces durbertensis]
MRGESRTRVALALLWPLTLILAAYRLVDVLGKAPDQRLTDLGGWLARNGPLGSPDTVYDGAGFTGTPLTAALLRPFGTLPEPMLGATWALGLLALVGALALLVVHALPGRVSRQTRSVMLPLVASVLLLAVPVRAVFDTGGPGLLPIVLVVAAFVYGGRSPWRDLVPNVPLPGLLIGFAAALQPTLLLFAPLLWLLGRRRQAVGAVGTFGLSTLVAWAALPAASADYWFGHFAGTGLGGAADDVGNQSLHGLLLRLGLSGTVEIILFVALAVAVAVLGLRRAAHYARDGQPLLAAAIAGCVVMAVTPAAWQHLQLWVLLAAVGRFGRRRGDRLVWPVLVVLVASLSAEALVPKIAWLAPLGENAPLLVALTAAVALPFVSTGSPLWDRPEPSGPFSRPHLMLELLLIRVGYFAYSYIRSLAPDGREIAESHGHQILAIERALRLDIELRINQYVHKTGWLEASMNFYYGAFHFLIPVALLAWLYLRRPADYRWARNALCYTTLLGLVGFLLYPLAPPRLMPKMGYHDTINGPQDFDDPNFGILTGISNQYAAMPSLHVGWSLWAGLVIIRLSPRLWVKALGALYPLLTTVVVMGTANHYLLDAFGGAAVVVAGFALAELWLRHGPASRADRLTSAEAADPAADPAAVAARVGAKDPVPAGATVTAAAGEPSKESTSGSAPGEAGRTPAGDAR